MNNPSIQEILSRRVSQILPDKQGLAKLLGERRIRLYMGFDPSSPNLHIGHLVGLLQMKMFQDLGHEVIFLIGDFTGMIGDPTDKSATRQKLIRDQVLQNAKTYKEQAGRILNFEGENPVKMVFNADWLMKLGFADVLEIASNVTVQQLIERDMFQKRLQDQKPIHLHEFMYPLLQGYDSVELEVDLEIGGNDQLFNLMMGRQLLKTIKNKEKYCLTTKLLADAQGNKVGKTTGNAVNLFGDPKDLFGGIMALSDDFIIPSFTLITEFPMDQIVEFEKQVVTEPMKLKKLLAFEVTRLCHGEQIASSAQAHFEQTIQNRQVDTIAEPIKLNLASNSNVTILQLAKELKLGESSGHIKHTIEQGGVEVDGQKITNPNQTIEIKGGEVIKFGKRTYKKIELNQ